MAKIKKIMTAGPLTIETIYPAPRSRDSPAARQGRKNITTQAMRMMNQKYAYQKVELQMAANLKPYDYNIVLTYDDAHLPPNRKAALKDFSAFLRKIRKLSNQPFVYFYRLEHKHKAGSRYHFHIYCTAIPITAKRLERLWGNGKIYRKDIIIDPDNTFEQLARYMIKERPDKLGQHLCDHSQGLRKIEVDRIRMPDDAQLQPPDGCLVLDDTGQVNTIYGSFRTIKYMVV